MQYVLLSFVDRFSEQNSHNQVNSLIAFLKDFYRKKGTWVFSAAVMNKIASFLTKVFVIVLLEEQIYGQVAYSLSVVSFFVPFVGFGATTGLMRYGAIADTRKEKTALNNYAFTTGLINTIVLCLLMIPVFLLVDKGESQIFLFMTILLGRVLGLFLFSYQTAKLRVEYRNKAFGQYDMVNSIALFIIALLLTYLFDAIGYLIALSVAPIITFLIYSAFYKFPQWKLKWDMSFLKKEYWSYSLLICFANSVSFVLFILDIYLISNMLGDKAAAEYSVAALIPINIIILPTIFIRTHYTLLAKNYRNRSYLTRYYGNFFKLFLFISVMGLLLSFFLGEWIFSLLNKDYEPYRIFMILMVGAVFAMLFRVPLGNMIAAFGKVWFNTASGIATFLLSLILNLILIPKYGLEGAAYATSISLCVSSLSYYFYYVFYLKYYCE